MKFLRGHLDDVLIVVGLATVVVGFGLISLPLGLIVGGVVLVACGLLFGGD